MDPVATLRRRSHSVPPNVEQYRCCSLVCVGMNNAFLQIIHHDIGISVWGLTFPSSFTFLFIPVPYCPLVVWFFIYSLMNVSIFDASKGTLKNPFIACGNRQIVICCIVNKNAVEISWDGAYMYMLHASCFAWKLIRREKNCNACIQAFF